ncbi:MAG: hypothetical protein KIT09_17730 [Bryobacteraceae bacterium]|nr:hypothetical protein [Bryobacteraceae bacterium]
MREQAIAALRRCCHGLGLRASGRLHGHRQIWARDSMICALGAAVIEDDEIHRAVLSSIESLAAAQTRLGEIPNNVDPETGRANFRAYADGGLWYVIARVLLSPRRESIAQTLAWYETQDVDQSGLLSMQESADWQDLFCTRGKGLYLNCLYALALRMMGEGERARRVADEINRWFWYEGDPDLFRHVAHSFSTESLDMDALGRKRWIPRKRSMPDEQFYLPYLSFREAGEWFDAFGNLLAILAGVAEAARARTILDFIERRGLDRLPIKSIFPPVRPGDSDWREYYGELNRPDHYHNGGIWPFLGGFFVAALVKAGEPEKAAAALARLEALNRAGEFNEWHHGETGEPMGVKDQAWSAAMYLYACACVEEGRVVLLDSGGVG